MTNKETIQRSNAPDDEQVATRLFALRERIALACTRSGRDPLTVTLVAVSKKKPATLIRAAYAAGQRDFGENYAQELAGKADELRDLTDIRWHFIGPLQRNKAKLLVGRTTLLHSVTSEEQLVVLAKHAEARGLVQELLLQVNVSGEQTQAGVTLDEAPALLDCCAASADHLRCVGLMTMPPPAGTPADNAPHFAALARLRDRLGGPLRLPTLSMGMSDDYEVAIANGATLVRVGSAIFGPR